MSETYDNWGAAELVGAGPGDILTVRRGMYRFTYRATSWDLNGSDGARRVWAAPYLPHADYEPNAELIALADVVAIGFQIDGE